MVRGQIVAVPTALAAVAIMVNKQLLRKLNLAVPRSMGQFERALVRAKAAGYTPIGIGNGFAASIRPRSIC